jgi:hypothetical protein
MSRTWKYYRETWIDWAVENEMKINPNKSKATCFTRAQVKDPLNYSLRDHQNIPEVHVCKYLGIIIRSDLSWTDQVNFPVQKAWRALHFIMHIVERGNNNTKSLAYTSLVRPMLGSIQRTSDQCFTPRTKKVAKFAHYTGGFVWESLAQRRMARLCALYKAYNGERAWKDIWNRVLVPYYQSRVHHCWK